MISLKNLCKKDITISIYQILYLYFTLTLKRDLYNIGLIIATKISIKLFSSFY